MHERGARAPGRTRAGCSTARRGCTARRWSGCGARCCRCPPSACACCAAASGSGRSASRTRPDTPPTTSPICTSPAGARSPATSPACASAPGLCSRRRRRRTSTCRRGALRWTRSKRWRPRSLAVTHFGGFDDVAEHLAALREHLDEVEAWASEGDEASFVARVRGARGAGGQAAGSYAQALPPEQSFQGLARYLRRREQAV